MLISGGLLLPLAARAEIPDTLSRAVAAMGGRGLLSRVKAIGWTGIGTLPNERRSNRLVVATRVEPFVTARSESWFQDQGAQTMRRMTITPEGGCIFAGGAEKAMPQAMLAHERAQFGLYGYMLLVKTPMLEAGKLLRGWHPGYPPIDLEIASDGTIAEARYTVPSHTGEDHVVQRLAFAGRVEDKGLRWPRDIAITVDGELTFALHIDKLAVELA